MKDLKLLVWLSQLGLSVALPPGGLILLAGWLHRSRGLGNWVLWVGTIAGAGLAIGGLRASLKTLDRLAAPPKDGASPTGSQDHHQHRR